MKEVSETVQAALAQHNYWAALMVAIAVPDICGALTEGSGAHNGDRYRRWYERYMDPKYHNFLPASTCWNLRNCLVHSGMDSDARIPKRKFLFTSGGRWHMNIFKAGEYEVMNFDVSFFCQDMLAAVQKWEAVTSGDPEIEKRKEALMAIRPVPDELKMDGTGITCTYKRPDGTLEVRKYTA